MHSPQPCPPSLLNTQFRLIAATLCVGVSLCFAAASAQAEGPFNAIAEAGDSALMLKGHDVVAYFTQSKHQLGAAEFKAQHAGATYRFASAAHLALFKQDPNKYVPQFGGFCTNGITYAIPWGGDADTWSIIDGKLYIFGGQASKNYFLMDLKKNLPLAEKYWAAEVKDSTAFVQRYKRLAFRVPHYQSGSALEAEWAAFKAAGKKLPY